MRGTPSAPRWDRRLRPWASSGRWTHVCPWSSGVRRWWWRDSAHGAQTTGTTCRCIQQVSGGRTQEPALENNCLIVCLLLITIKLKITKDNLGKKTTSIKNYVILLLLLPLKETNAKRKATAVRTTTMSLSILRNNGDNIISNFLASFLLMRTFWLTM